MKRTIVSILILQLALLLSSPARAAETVSVPKQSLPTAIRLDGTELYNRTVNGLAWVLTPDGAGTAWVLDRERQVLVTACHVVTNSEGNPSETVKLIFPVVEDGEIVAERKWYGSQARRLAVDAVILAMDPVRDLAFLRAASLPASARALPLASRGVRPGQPVASVGNPGASEALWVYNEGTVRQTYRTGAVVGKQELSARVVETQNPINGGDSGGPLVNLAGEVVAVNSGKHVEASLVSFSIDVSEVKSLLATRRSLIAPETAEDYLARGNLQRDQKQDEMAVADYDTVIRLDPRNAEAYRQRVGARVRQGRLDRALADCGTLLRLAPKDASSHTLRAAVVLQQGKHSAAIASATLAIELDPERAEGYLLRGRAHAGVGEHEKAVADFSRAVDLAKDPTEGYERRGDSLSDMGEHDRAAEDYRKAIASAGTDIKVQTRLLKKVADMAKKRS